MLEPQGGLVKRSLDTHLVIKNKRKEICRVELRFILFPKCDEKLVLKFNENLSQSLKHGKWIEKVVWTEVAVEYHETAVWHSSFPQLETKCFIDT